MRFAFTRSTFSSGGGCLFAFTPSKKSFTSFSTIFVFSSTVLSYGNFSRGLRGGPNLYCLPLAVLLDAGADRAATAVFFRACLQGRGEGLRCAGAAGAAAGLFRPWWQGGEGGGWWLLGRAGAGGEGGECRHAPEKEAECPDRHSPEEEEVEEAECPDSAEEEEEAEASSSEG